MPFWCHIVIKKHPQISVDLLGDKTSWYRFLLKWWIWLRKNGYKMGIKPNFLMDIIGIWCDVTNTMNLGFTIVGQIVDSITLNWRFGLFFRWDDIATLTVTFILVPSGHHSHGLPDPHWPHWFRWLGMTSPSENSVFFLGDFPIFPS